MTDTNPPTPPTPPEQPPANPPPPAGPPGTPTTWPGAASSTTAPWQAPPSPWGQPPGMPQYAPKHTNGLAITALVLGLVALMFWPLALFLGIAAVITGHIARGQIRRSKEQGAEQQGAGMALAGLILGYIWIALSILGAIALVLILTLAVPAATQVSVRHDARDFGLDARSQAVADETTPRNAKVVQEVYRQRYLAVNESTNKRAHLPDGTGLLFVTDSALRSNNYRIEFSEDTLGTKHACLTLPATAQDEAIVDDGRC
jgi:uncharacterized membrane protein